MALFDIDIQSQCSRCLTQNANESYNTLPWKAVPKEQYSSATQIQSAMCPCTIFLSVGHLAGGKRVIEVA